MGVQMPPHEEIQDPAYCDFTKIRNNFLKYGDALVGLKVRVHEDVTGDYGLKALEAAGNVAGALRGEGFTCRLMVHFGNLAEGITLRDVLDRLAPGDVMTHIYRTNGTTIFDDDGQIAACMVKARERGVIFESGCARMHCSLESIKKAMALGFYPNIISTDLIGATFFWKPSFSLAFKMSIYLNAGMPLADIVKAVTLSPAAAYNLQEQAGTLTPGRPADLAVFRIDDRPFQVDDLFGGSLTGDKLLVPMATVKAGSIVFQQVFL
ncbi:hypothetical protein KL86DPRO_40141 [uncultured delta proteobacterium]|uniref:Amidohydrolase-related domain-containing protein n=1 Tax=uncultured delta proteobacterium TaxID=34034 RepID=A0A212KA72_9DELT|nr:hypothetical protein KL86DPRO_40141 [uncultured delta proteobacterium]